MKNGIPLGYLGLRVIYPPLPLDASTRKVLIASIETNQQQEGNTDRM